MLKNLERTMISMLKRLIPARAQRLLHIRYCPVWLPWFYSADGLAKLQRLAVRAMLRERRANGETFWVLAEACSWPISTFIQAVRSAFGRYGMEVHAAVGMGRVRQIVQQVWLANRYHICSYYYYTYRLWKADNYSKAALYGYHPPFEGLLKLISAGADMTVCYDKASFARHCIEHGLPSIPVYAIFRETGEAEWLSEHRELPSEDIFIKPVSLGGGTGAESWEYRSDGSWTRNGRALSHDELISHIRNQSKQYDMLVMPRIRNASDLPTFGTSALMTLRIVTYKANDADEIRCLSAAARIPMLNSDTDNVSDGGMAAPIMGDGLLGKARSNKIIAVEISAHPETGVRIEGLRIAGYLSARDLCLSAHRTIPELAAIGWDVAITDDGPVLVEANSTWNAGIVQVPVDQPLGETMFVEWAHERLALGNCI